MDDSLGPLSRKEIRKLRKVHSSASAAASPPATALPSAEQSGNPPSPAPVSSSPSELPEAAVNSNSAISDAGATQSYPTLPPLTLPAAAMPTPLEVRPTPSSATAQPSAPRRPPPKKKWAPVDLGELAPDAMTRLDWQLPPKKARQPANQHQSPAKQPIGPATYSNAAVAPTGADTMAWATQRQAAPSLQAEHTSLTTLSPPSANPVGYTQLGSMKIYPPGYKPVATTPSPAVPAATTPSPAVPVPTTPAPATRRPAARAPLDIGQWRHPSSSSPSRPPPAHRRPIPEHKRLTTADIIPGKFVNIQALSASELAALPADHNEGWRGHPGEVLGTWEGEVAVLGTTSFKGLGMAAKFAAAHAERRPALERSFMLLRGRDDAVPAGEDPARVLRLDGPMAFYPNTRMDTRAVRWIPRERFHLDCSNFFVKDTTVPVFLSRESFERQERQLLELAGQELAWKKEDQDGLRRYAEYRARERSLREM
ncbi:uncharacterized protein LTHEOB_9330 [Neofusicoccum parvum]|nr:uncharacterized protein LTHEOB_9330 [Neofusicoccum parvum]